MALHQRIIFGKLIQRKHFMKNKSKIVLSITSFGVLFLIASFVDIYTPITCNIIMKSSIDSNRDFAQVFFDTGNDYNEKESIKVSKKHRCFSMINYSRLLAKRSVCVVKYTQFFN